MKDIDSTIGDFLTPPDPPRIRKVHDGDVKTINKAKGIEIAGRVEELFGRILTDDEMVKLVSIHRSDKKPEEIYTLEGQAMLHIEVVFTPKKETFLHIRKIAHPRDNKNV